MSNRSFGARLGNWIFPDLTERKQAEAALQQSHQETEAFLDAVPMAIIATNEEGSITRWSQSAAEILGASKEEALSHRLHQCGVQWLNPEQILGFEKEMREKHKAAHDGIGFRKRDQENRLLGLKARFMAAPEPGQGMFILTGADITERKTLETQLNHAQKLEAIGQLAAGIAHEINTPTQFVSDNLAFLQESWKVVNELLALYRDVIRDVAQPTLGPQLRQVIDETERNADIEFMANEIPRAIEQALDGTKRVAKIVRAMKEFSHPDSGEKTATDINKAIETTITVARNEWKYVAEIETSLDGTLPPIPCYPGELNQVILNLIVNAAHAIKDKVHEGEKGRITVRTRAKDDVAEITISDTGTGIPEAIRSRIFDPFFTTKEVGKGTGQGLAIAHSVIANKHSGKVWFETEMGRGTTFYINLPMNGGSSEGRV